MALRWVLPVLLLGACTPAGDGSADSDTDVEEQDTDVESYACGWPTLDPGDLVSTGSAVGDVVADWSGLDGCGEDYRIWDGFGRYTLVMMPVFW